MHTTCLLEFEIDFLFHKLSALNACYTSTWKEVCSSDLCHFESLRLLLEIRVEHWWSNKPNLRDLQKYKCVFLRETEHNFVILWAITLIFTLNIQVSTKSLTSSNLGMIDVIPNSWMIVCSENIWEWEKSFRERIFQKSFVKFLYAFHVWKSFLKYYQKFDIH